MPNLDRFKPPEEITATCVNCGAERPADAMLFDERAEHFVCDRGCFDDWHDDNFEQVGEYYFERNVG